MKKFYPVFILALFFLGFRAVPAFAQSGVLDPTDPIVNYDPTNPPTAPAYNSIAKWVRTPTLSWNTSLWKAYYYNGIAFRIIFPADYLTNPAKTFPLLVFFHGEGEKGTVYNNELQLANCGQAITKAVQNNAFDGFVIFPQSTYGGWDISQFTSVAGFIDSMINEVRVDPNRIIASGLSSGGDGTWRFASQYPNLVATAVPISASTSTESSSSFISTIQDIPIWLSQGGLDQNPTLALTNSVVSAQVQAGMDIQTVQPGQEGIGRVSEGYYIVYPNNAHNTWDAHYAEPQAFSYMMQAYKSNPHVYFGRRQFCPGDTINVKLEVTPGFSGYQWSNNGIVIPGATTNSITVTDTGTYAVMINNGGIWSDWSHTPAHISYSPATQTPPIQVAGLMSRVIPAPDGNTSVNLTLPPGYATYQWMNATGQVVGNSQGFTAKQPGNYTAIVKAIYGCSSLPSAPFNVAANSGPNPPSAATGLTAFALSQTTVQVNWSRNLHPVNSETAFEVYRATQSGGPYQLAGIAPADTVEFIDKNLIANTKYYYIVRAIDSTGAAPVSKQDSVITVADTQPPTAPGHLVELAATPNSVVLNWNSSTDNVAVQNYYVYVNGVRTYVTNDTSFTVNNLNPQQYYTFTVKAVDPSGNISAPSNQVVAAAAYASLKFKYYTFTGNWTSLPNFSTQTVADSGWVKNISLSSATQTTNFAFTFQGYINIRRAGTYTFYTNSDDGSNLYINGTKVVSNDGQHGTQQKSGTYNFTQTGVYPFEVDYFQQGGGYSLSVSWQANSAGIPMSQIPDSAFVASVQLNGSAPVQPTVITATALSYHQVNLNWKDNSNNETGFEIYRANASAGPWQIIYTTKAGVTAFADSLLSPSTTYYYEVQAVNQYGSSGFVAQTPGSSATTLALPAVPSAPVNLVATAISISQVNLNWSDTSSTITGYNIYRSDGNANSFRKLQQVSASTTSYADSSLFPNTTYYYQITASNTGGASGYSNTAYATTLNQLPKINGIANKYIRYDTATVVPISATDPDGDTLRFSIINLPPFGTLQDNGNGTGTITFSPSSTQGGTYPGIKLIVTDQYGAHDSTTFTLSVGANNPPVIQPVAPIQVNTFTSTTDTIFIADGNVNASITWQITGLPSFVNTATDNNGDLILKIQPGANNAGNYSFLVSATDNYGGNDQKTVSLTVNYVPLKKWYINFATNFGWMTYPGNPWNNVRSDTATNLKDNGGNSSSVGLQLHTNWWGTQMAGAQTGNNSGVYSDTVMRDDYYFGALGGPNAVAGSVTGLDTSKTYSITFFGSSNWQGTTDNGYTIYQIGPRSDSIHVQNNTSKTVTFSNIKPGSDGSIAFTVSRGTGAVNGYMNAMVVSMNASISPATPLNVQLNNQAVNGRTAVQVNWQAGSNNTDTVNIYRSVTRSGGYALINPGIANGYATNYLDTGIAQNNTYYYYVVAANAYGSSASSDTVAITIPQYIDNRKWYINFATNFGWMTYPGSPWNNVRSDTVTNLKDNGGNSSSIGLQLHTNWWATYTHGAQTGNNSGVYSDTVMRDDYYFGALGGPNTVAGSVTGLDTSKTYSITFFGSSNWQGTADNGYTIYQIGSRADSIHVQNNTSKTVTFSNIKPGSDGSIAFTVSRGTGAVNGYMNAMVVSTDIKALPATPLSVQVINQTSGGKNQANVTWQLASTNATTIQVYRSTNKLGNYILLNPNMPNGYKTSYADANVISDSTYYYYVVAANASGSSTSSDTASLTIPQYIDNRTWYINFATNYGWMPYPGSPWNNVRSDTVTNLKDNGGNSSSVGLQLYTNWWATYTHGAQTGNNSGVYSDTVMRDDYYFGALGGPTTVTGSVTGLDTSKTYNVTFFGSSNWQGTPDNGYTIYQIGSLSDSIHVQNNTSKTVTFSNIKPASDGSVAFTVSRGAGAANGYINAMIVTTYAAFPPAAPINFLLKNKVVNGKTTVEVDWQAGSNNTDTIKVFRSTAQAGGYTLINAGAGSSSSSYTDTSVNLNAAYYYYLVASNVYGASATTDTLYDTVTNLLPAKPQNLQLSNIAINGGKTDAVQLNWQLGSTNADTIQVYRSSSSAGNYALINPGVANGGSTSYADTAIALSTTYYYYLVAVNRFGNSGPTDTVIITTNAAPLPPPVMTTIPTQSVSVGALDTIPVSASASGSAVTFVIQNAPSFVTINTTGSNSARLILSPHASDYGFYDSIKVTANAANGTSASQYFNIYVTQGGLSDAIYLSFTDGAHMFSQRPWNNLVYKGSPNSLFNNLTDYYGQPTNVSLNLVNAWSGEANLGGNTYNNSGFVPDSVMGSYYYVSDTATRTMQIAGLDTGKRYNFVFFASTYNMANADYTTIYTINGQSASLNGISNTTRAVRINGIKPDSTGTITVSIAKGSVAAQGILNAMIIESYPNGMLVAPGNLKAVANNGNVNLTWNDCSYNEQQFQVWRSQSANGTYANIGNVPAGTTSYVDATVMPDTRYFYKVIVTAAGGLSQSSNIASATTTQFAVYVSFDQNTPSPMPWNNLNTEPVVGDVFSLYDSRGNNTGINMLIGTGFSGINPYGVNTGNNSGVYPDNVISNTYWVDANATGQVTLQGLNLSKSYDLTFFGSRVATADRTTIYIANGQKVALQVANDSTQTVTIPNVAPDANGNITIGVTAGGASVYGYIGALVIQAHDNYDSTGTQVINPNLFTYNRQKHGIDFSTSPLSGLTDTVSKDFKLEGDVYPNPFDQFINLRLNCPQDGILLMTLYSSNGEIMDKQTQAVAAGYNLLQYRSRPGLTPGVYILSLKMTSGNKMINAKLIKVSQN